MSLWPQYTMVAIYALTVMMSAVLDGLPRSGHHSLAQTMLGTIIGVYILHAGGFWAPLLAAP